MALWIARDKCQCKGVKSENVVSHPAWSDWCFCPHQRTKSEIASKKTKHHDSVVLNDSKFRYVVTVNSKVWNQQLKKNDEKLYYFVICCRAKKETRKALFEDYLIHNVCLFLRMSH